MATPRYAWDSCAWIAMIIQEQSPVKGGGFEDRGKLCNHVIGLAAKKQLEIVTSGLALAEVCKHDEVKAVDGDDLSDFFKNDYILVVATDRNVGTLARKLMQGGHPGLKPPDAVHLATAIVADVKGLHTFDKKLLGLDGKLEIPSGGVLNISSRSDHRRACWTGCKFPLLYQSVPNRFSLYRHAYSPSITQLTWAKTDFDR